VPVTAVRNLGIIHDVVMLNPLRDTHAGQPSLRPSARDARPGGAGLIRAATAHRRSRGVAPAADRRRPSRRIASPL
jgi:hypothetical protein